MNSGKLRKPVGKIPEFLSAAFVFYMSTFFVLFMNNGYFDITGAKLAAFRYGALVFAVLTAISLPVKFIFEGKAYASELSQRLRPVRIPLIFLLCFAAGVIVSCSLSDYGNDAWTGPASRRLGGWFYLGCVFVCLLLVFCFRKGRLSAALEAAFAATVLIVTVLEVFQYCGNDLFGLYENISENERTSFISTLGNTNYAASFFSLAIPLFAGLSLISEYVSIRLVSLAAFGISIVGAYLTLADSWLLSFSACMAVMIIFVGRLDLKRVSFLIFAAAAAFALLRVIVTSADDGFFAEEFAEKGLQQRLVSIGFIAILAAAGLLLFLIGTIEVLHGFRDILTHAFPLITILGITVFAVLFILVNSGVNIDFMQVFVVDDSWGSFRGFIWRISIGEFESLTAVRKLFGIGSDCFANVLRENRLSEMVLTSNSVYVDAHSEFLQSLLCHGIFGFTAYIGFFVSSAAVFLLRFVKKNSAQSLVGILCIAGFLGQGLVNNPQVLTTPLVFVLMGAVLAEAHL